MKRSFLVIVLAFCFFIPRYSFAEKNEKLIVFYFSIADSSTFSTNERVADIFLKIGDKQWFEETIFVGDKLTIGNSFPNDSLISLQIKTYRGFVCEIRNGEEKLKTNFTKKVIDIKDTVFIDLKIDESNTYQYLYYSLDKKTKKPYRIPALAQTSEGTLLAVSDHRPCWADIGFGEVDLKIRTSKDYKNF